MNTDVHRLFDMETYWCSSKLERCSATSRPDDVIKEIIAIVNRSRKLLEIYDLQGGVESERFLFFSDIYYKLYLTTVRVFAV